MALPKDLTTIVSDEVTAAQAQSTAALDSQVGSPLRALFEAVAGVALWLQALIMGLLGITRASTSTGSDLDSWMADYGLTRVGASPAAGSVTFSRATATAAATIPVDSLVQTFDGSQQYKVIADATNPAYNVAQNAYLLPIGQASVAVAVQDVVGGSAGNVPAGYVNLLSQAIPYVDSVVNPAAMSGGGDIETDAAFRARFVLFLGSLSQATLAAIEEAIESVSTALSYKISENKDAAGATRYGYFTVALDDGSGATPVATINAVYAAIQAVRGFTIAYAVIAAAPIVANVTLTIGVASGFTASQVRTAVQNALLAYITSLGVGDDLDIDQVVRVAFSVSGVQSVPIATVLINGSNADLVTTEAQVITTGSVVCS